MNGEHATTAFRAVPRTGVIFVTTEAVRRGYSATDPEWCNLGQGQPETGELPGGPPRVTALEIDPGDQEYAPVAGLWELREAVAGLYNRLYRRGLPSQYSAENVSIASGGRTALTRVAASIGTVNLGHFLPDYTAYEELLSIFRAFTAIPILLEGDRGYTFGPEDLRREVLGRGLSAILASNPCNPTGKHIRGDDLSGWVKVARELDCTLILDEFYSHYIWTASTHDLPVESAARYVEDVDRDPVVLIDGLTKNWRYPGWRVSWTVGPKDVIEAVASAGSFLDGGGSKPLQRVAVPLLAEEPTIRETRAIVAAFRQKRDFLIRRLRRMGVGIDLEPEGTFYVWGKLSGLAPPLRDGMALFRAALEHKIITVPGQFFDVNPGKRRGAQSSRFNDYVRFSFGPPQSVLETACNRLEALLDGAKKGAMSEVVNRAELEALPRAELLAEARRRGVRRAEVMTRVELMDEVLRLATPNPVERKQVRGWLGVARDLIADVVEQGLHLPDAAAFIRGDVRFEPLRTPQAPVATVTLAEIYGAQGHFERALGILDEVLAKEPDHAVARNLRDKIERDQNARKARTVPVLADQTDAEPTTERRPKAPAASSVTPADEPEPSTHRRGDDHFVRDDVAIASRTTPDAVVVFFEVGTPAGDGELVVRIVEMRPRARGRERMARDIAVQGPQGAVSVDGVEPDSVVRAALGLKRDGEFRALAVAAVVSPSATGVEVVWAPRRTVDYAALHVRVAAGAAST